MKVKPTTICLLGSTACGKSQLALQIAKHISIEIISVDSVNVYRGMDIGAAKPTLEERAQVPYHLIDIRDPKEPYSAADFCRDALQKIGEIFERGNIPLLVGGTILYFHALLFGLSPLPSANISIRQKLLEEAERKGWESLHKRLALIDPESAKRIHAHDPQRLQRALEVFEITGKPLSVLQKQAPKVCFPFKKKIIALVPNSRHLLHQRIKERFLQMLEQGFLEEVKKLYDRGDLHSDLPAIRSVGYRQMWAYLEGKYTWEEMKEKAIAATRQLAKRQLTWLRNWPEELHRLDSEDQDLLSKVLKMIGS